MTTQSKITPGPWQHGETEYTGITNHPPLLPLSFQRIFMPGNSMVFVTGADREANAQAIATVPEFIAALRGIKEWFDLNSESGQSIPTAEYDAISKALAKAGV